MIARTARPLRFGAVGLFNTALGLGVIFGAKAFLGFGDLAANLLGYGLGLVASFVLNRSWTFRHEGPAGAAFWRFVIAFGVAYGLNLVTVFGLRDAVVINSYLAQACGVVTYTISFYLLSVSYVFPARRTRVEESETTTKTFSE